MTGAGNESALGSLGQGVLRLSTPSRVGIFKTHSERRASGAAAGSANPLLIMMRFSYNLALRWEVPGIGFNSTTLPKNLGTEYVFGNPRTGRPFVTIFIAWDTARTKAGLSDVRVHDLRHSFASFCVNAGHTLYAVQKLLGHSQQRTTERYAHLAPETPLAASNAATLAVGSVMGVMPIRVVDVPLVAVQG